MGGLTSSPSRPAPPPPPPPPVVSQAPTVSKAPKAGAKDAPAEARRDVGTERRKKRGSGRKLISLDESAATRPTILGS